MVVGIAAVEVSAEAEGSKQGMAQERILILTEEQAEEIKSLLTIKECGAS